MKYIDAHFYLRDSLRSPLVRDALSVAKHAHPDHQLRESGERYITHPLTVAAMYKQLFPNDEIGLCACLLHDVTEEESSIRIDDLKIFFGGRYGQKIAFIVNALTKKPLNSFQDRNEQTRELYSRFFPSAHRDRRVATIRLLDRFHNVMTIDALEPIRAQRIIKETTEVLIPFFYYLHLPMSYELAGLCQNQNHRVQTLLCPYGSDISN